MLKREPKGLKADLAVVPVLVMERLQRTRGNAQEGTRLRSVATAGANSRRRAAVAKAAEATVSVLNTAAATALTKTWRHHLLMLRRHPRPPHRLPQVLPVPRLLQAVAGGGCTCQIETVDFMPTRLSVVAA